MLPSVPQDWGKLLLEVLDTLNISSKVPQNSGTWGALSIDARGLMNQWLDWKARNVAQTIMDGYRD